jgi:uncharacterized protein YgiM (DUF1202 family)
MKLKLSHQQKWHLLLVMATVVFLSGCVKQPSLPQEINGEIVVLKKVIAKLIKENEDIKRQILNQNAQLQTINMEIKHQKNIASSLKQMDAVEKNRQNNQEDTEELAPFLIHVIKDRVNLRAEPHLDSVVYELLPKGQALLATKKPSKNMKWYEVLHEGRISWVHETLVKEQKVE